MERVSERPTAACPNELEDEIVADGYDNVSQVRDFDTQFFTDHGEIGAPNGPVEDKAILKAHILKGSNVEKTPSSRQVKGLMQANVCSVQVKIMKIIMKII